MAGLNARQREAVSELVGGEADGGEVRAAIESFIDSNGVQRHSGTEGDPDKNREFCGWLRSKSYPETAKFLESRVK